MKKVNVNGAIIPNDIKWIYDLFEIDATSPNDVNEIIDNSGDDLEVEINSGGGDVMSGSQIFSSLKDSNHKVTVKVTGIAASSASVIAMAGDEVQVSPTAQMMIHNVSSGAEGDHKDLKHQSDVLKNYNKSIANSYIMKTGKSEDDILNMMNKETWLTAQQAKEQGFADKIMFEDDANNGGNLSLVASMGNSVLLPDAVINKMQNEKFNEQLQQQNKDEDEEEQEQEEEEECDPEEEECEPDEEKEDTTYQARQAQAKLDLLKLKAKL